METLPPPRHHGTILPLYWQCNAWPRLPSSPQSCKDGNTSQCLSCYTTSTQLCKTTKQMTGFVLIERNIFQCLVFIVLNRNHNSNNKAGIQTNNFLTEISYYVILNFIQFQNFSTFIWWKFKGFKLKLIRKLLWSPDTSLRSTLRSEQKAVQSSRSQSKLLSFNWTFHNSDTSIHFIFKIDLIQRERENFIFLTKCKALGLDVEVPNIRLLSLKYLTFLA